MAAVAEHKSGVQWHLHNAALKYFRDIVLKGDVFEQKLGLESWVRPVAHEEKGTGYRIDKSQWTR